MSGTGAVAVVPSLGGDARWPSRAELRALTERMPAARPTRYGSVNVRTRVTERSTAATVVVGNGRRPGGRTIDREAAARFARLQDRYLAARRSVVVEGHLGHTGGCRSRARLVVELANANVAAMQRELYVDAGDLPAGAGVAPDITVVDTPNLAVPGVPGGRLAVVWPEEGITRIAGSDYFDDAKKAAVRLWGVRVRRAGGLLLHAGCTVVETDGGPRAMLLLGRSGAGKSTLTFSGPPGASLAQDDFVALFPGGEVVAAEAGCIEKDSLVDPVRQPAIHAAATGRDAYLENVSQVGADPTFGARPGGPGRVVFGMQAVAHWPAARIPPASFLVVLHPWDGVVPAVARLSVEQAAACLLLRELGGPAGHPGAAGSATLEELAGQAERLRALLDAGRVQAYLLNTGRVGGPEGDHRAKPVRVEHARAVLAAIAAGSVEWEPDPDFGWLTAATVPGVDDAELLQPRRLYRRQRRLADHRRQVRLLQAAHAAYLACFPGLDGAVASSLRGGDGGGHDATGGARRRHGPAGALVSAAPAVRARLAAALAGDDGADGARWALRAPGPRALLRRQLAAMLPAGQPLGPCRLRRAKFKPGRRLNAWYDLDLGAAGRRPVAVTWEDPPPAPDWPAADAMEAQAAAAGLAAPFLRLRSAVPELGLRVLVAPLDPAFGQLLRLTDPAQVPGLLAAAGADAVGSGRPWSVAAVRYRPGQRHVLRWQQGGARDRAVFAKLYRRGGSAQAFRLASRVADWLDGVGGPVAGARPLGHLPEADVLLYPFVPGTQLVAGLGHGGGAVLAQRLVRAGAILRALHAAPPELAEGLPGSSFDDAAEEVHKAAAHVRFLLPATGAALEELLDRARKLHARLPGEADVFAHADYKSDHLLATPERLTVIDFDTCALADPALDLGKLVADLRFWAFRGLAVDPDWARARLLEGYGPASRPRLLRARLYEALVLAKLTVRRVSVADPDWAGRTTALVGRSAGLLDGLEREVGA